LSRNSAPNRGRLRADMRERRFGVEEPARYQNKKEEEIDTWIEKSNPCLLKALYGAEPCRPRQSTKRLSSIGRNFPKKKTKGKRENR